VSIGATLAAARRRSGLTLSEVSDRAGVTEPIIRGIEQDDYAACGGDSIARSHIRAIAGAVGEDPVPLMDEFDATWRSEDDGPAADGSAGATAAVVTAAVEAFPPARPTRTRERRRVRWTAFLAVLVVAVLGFASYELATGVGKAHNAAASTHPGPSRPASQPATVPAVTPSAKVTTAQPSPPATPSVTPVAARTLALAGVAAFGPAGTADGDNPRLASRAIADDPATPWESQWYATAAFGDLKTGTGLLVDLGRTVTVTSVRLSLGGRPGAHFQVRVGRTPVLSDLRSVATSAGRSGTVRLRLASPVQARYLLIWFTLLPPDGAGTYQLSVYDITVQGLP
jgi:cytoskeleton protein RodZ